MAGRRTSTLDALVVCPPGLEGMVADELAALGVSRTRTEKGGVTCRLTTRQLYAANLFLRCATRVLVRVAGFTVRSFADLERRASRWILTSRCASTFTQSCEPPTVMTTAKTC